MGLGGDKGLSVLALGLLKASGSKPRGQAPVLHVGVSVGLQHTERAPHSARVRAG